MKDSHFTEQDHSDAASFALADFRPKLPKEGLDVLPLDVCAGWVSEDCVERALMLPLHEFYGTTKEYHIETTSSV